METPKEGYCEWTENEGSPNYTECGHSFMFNEDGVHENKFVFCPYCGGNITITEGKWESFSGSGED